MSDPALDPPRDLDPAHDLDPARDLDPAHDLDPPVDLDAMGAMISAPDVRAEDAARARLGEERLRALGDLGRLALWWAGVCSDGAAGPPELVQAVGIGAVDAAAAPRPARSIRAVPLDPPAEIGDALRYGAALADDAADRGVRLLLLAVADPAAGRLLSAQLMGLDAVEAAGWPAGRGLSDQEWMTQVEALRDGLYRTRGLRGRPGDLLAAIASPALAAATAFTLQAAARRTPVLLDGPTATAAALLARRSAWDAALWWRAAHSADEPLHTRALASLSLQPMTRLALATEEGVGAIAALALLDLAASQLAAVPPASALPTAVRPQVQRPPAKHRAAPAAS